MKKKLMILLGTMLAISIIGVIIINLVTPAMSRGESREDKLKIVATFYPVYMIGLNLADQIEDLEVRSLTNLSTGCLHDYQLTTEDMKLISEADVLLINGAGMEGFLQDVTVNYPQLTIIDATDGITLLANEAEDEHEEDGEDHEEEEESHHEHHHGEYNSHVWLDPQLYMQQIENVRDGLLEYIHKIYGTSSGLAGNIEENAQTYLAEVLELDAEISQLSEKAAMSFKQEELQAVIFHESFAYLAKRIGMKIAYTVPLDSDTALSAGDIAEIIQEVKKEKIKYLFTEEQYSTSIAKQIEAETGAKMYIIDSAVTGNGSKASYLEAMNRNIEVLKQALQN